MVDMVNLIWFNYTSHQQTHKANIMKQQISENTDLRTVQTIIDEAIAQGFRVVHRPTVKSSNVVSLLARQEAKRVLMANVSPEVG